MNRLIIVGSPRVDGRSAELADLLFESCIDEFPGEEVALVPVSTLNIAGCVGCDACKQPDDEGRHRCAVQDDMQGVYEQLDAADEVIVVSPVYFSGPPSQLKALFDRLQPYFWARFGEGAVRNELPYRPATLHVVGEGGDPHGFDPLVGVVRSALGCVGCTLETVFDWVGRIDADGEIVEEALRYDFNPDTLAFEEEGFEEDSWVELDAETPDGAVLDAASADDFGIDDDDDWFEDARDRTVAPKDEPIYERRPKLDFNAGAGKAKAGKASGKQAGASDGKCASSRGKSQGKGANRSTSKRAGKGGKKHA